MEILTLLSVLPLICIKDQEIQLIRALTDYFNFDHHFFLLDSHAETNRYLDKQGITPQSLFVVKSVDDVTGLDDVKEITSKNAFLIVVPQFDKNFTLLRRIKRIQRLQISMKIGVFFQQHASVEDLHKFFEWCKDNLIIKIFAATYPCTSEINQSSCAGCSINIFTFEPFGELDVINVTSSETFDGFFLSRNSNFQQHQLKLGRIPGNGTQSDDKVWLNVIRLMNASSLQHEYIYNNVSDAFAGGIDLLPRLLSQRNLDVLGSTYPVKMISYGIIVPEASPYSQFSAYLRKATTGEFCGYSFVAIVGLVLVLSIPRYIKQKKVSFCQSTVDVFNLLMNDNAHIKYQRLSRPEIFVIVPLTFVGLIFTNGILSALKSYHTQPLLQPQIDTLDDIYASGFPIVVFNKSWQKDVIEKATNQTGGKDWSSRVFYDENYDKYLEAYNQTMSYFGNSYSVEVILKIQKRLKIKGFYNTRIKVASYLFGYRVNAKFLFFERLNDILHRMKSSGVYDLWRQRDLRLAEKRILKINVEGLMNNKESYVGSIEFPTFLFYGWLAGLIVFVFEIICKRFYFSWMRTILLTIVRKFGH